MSVYPGVRDRSVGQRLAEVRVDRGFTQEELAALLGVSTKQYRRYEKGTASIPRPRLDEIAMWLGCETARLLEPRGSPMPRRRERITPVADYEGELVRLCNSGV